MSLELGKYFGLSGIEGKSNVLSYHEEALESYWQGMEILASDIKTRIPEVIERFQVATELDPNFTLAYVGLATSYLNYEQTAESALSEDEVKALLKEAAEAAYNMDDSLAEVHILMGELKLKEWDRVGALASFNRALQIDPDCAAAFMGLGRLEFQKRIPPWDPAYLSFMNEVIDLKKKAVDLDPGNALYHFELVFSFGYLAKVEASTREYQLSVSSNSQFAKGHAALASDAINFMGRFDEAMPHLRRALALDLRNLEYTIDIRDCYESLGDVDQAIQWTERILSLREDLAPFYIADFHRLKGDHSQAIEAYRELLNTPVNIAGKDKARRLLLNYDLREGRFEEARRRYYAVAISLFDENPSVESHGEAVFAMELASLLKATGETTYVNQLVDGSWEFFKHIPEKDHTRAFYEILKHTLKGNTRLALETFEKAVDAGFRSQLDLEDARLDPLRKEPEFVAAMKRVENDMAKQLTAIREMEANGELEPIP